MCMRTCAMREAMSVLGDSQALWDALVVANPIAVTERLSHASLRQRNAYFSSSDAAFRDRYEASAEWELAKAGEVAVDGGWRIYSSGPGIYVALVVQHALGVRRRFGKRISKRSLPRPARNACGWSACRPAADASAMARPPLRRRADRPARPRSTV